MKTIVLASQKGGVGKTTLAANLAVSFAQSYSVCMLDADPQGSLTQWWKRRDAENPALFDLGDKGYSAIPKALQAMEANGVELAIIDTRPSVTAEIAEIVASADIVVIPTRAALQDVTAALPTAQLAKQSNKPLLFVVNASRSPRLATEAMAALSKRGPVASMIGDRLAFVDAYGAGQAVTEYERSGKASKEVQALSADILEMLNYG